MDINEVASKIIKEVVNPGSAVNAANVLQVEYLRPLMRNKEFITFVSAIYETVEELINSDQDEIMKKMKLGFHITSIMAVAMMIAANGGEPGAAKSVLQEQQSQPQEEAPQGLEQALDGIREALTNTGFQIEDIKVQKLDGTPVTTRSGKASGIRVPGKGVVN